MKNNKGLRSCILILGVLLILGIFLLAGYRFLAMRVAVNTPPPQILIHRPYNQAEISLEAGTFLHATAHSAKGIDRIELWIDGQFIKAEEAPQNGAVTPMVLHAYWQPAGIGLHEVIVRAYDTTRMEGTGSILLTAVRSGELDGSETALPEAAPTEPAGPAGDPVEEVSLPAPVFPGSSGGSPSYNPPGENVLPADDTPPERNFLTFDFVFWELFRLFGRAEEEAPVPEASETSLVKFEALSLDTGTGYEGVHCYFGLAELIPSWYPDTDGNQATDENFPAIGTGQWEVASFLSEGNSILAPWPNNDPVALSVSCIGTAGGGTQAVDLGRVEVSIPAGDWDGITRTVEAAAEGSFRLSYRITRQEMPVKELDPAIPAPYNLRIDHRRQELLWDWDPGEENESAGVVGFLLYVNDILVFDIPDRTARAARLPDTWFYPPCRMEYAFSVRAYRAPYPDGDYSPASEPLIFPDPAGPARTDCQPEFLIEFHTLETGVLPGDDNIPNNWANTMNSVVGSFFANGEEVIFQGATLDQNRTYDLNELVAADPGGMSRVVVEPLPGQNIRIGFSLATYEGWDGFDDFCTTMLYHDYSFSELMSYGYFEDTLHSYEDEGSRCRVHYTIRPVVGTPFGIDNPNFPPLPWLDVVGLRQESGTGLVQVELKNTGSADWANQFLRLSLIDRVSDVPFSTAVDRQFFLGLGETRWVTALAGPSEGDLSRTCVIIDPDNQVLELYENSGAIQHVSMRYCPPLPDLRLSETSFDLRTNTLQLHVLNRGGEDNAVGSSAIDLANLEVWIVLEDGRSTIPASPGQFGPGVLGSGQDTWLEWPLLPQQAELLTGGYQVVLDPENKILETDEDNNSVSERGAENLRVMWNGMILRWYPNALQECPNYGRWATNPVDVWVKVLATGPGSNREIAEWHYEGRVGDEDYLFEGRGWNPTDHVVDFTIRGEETMLIEVRGEQGIYSMGSATGIFEPHEDWDAHMRILPSGQCITPEGTRGSASILILPTHSDWRWCGGWWVYFNVCTVSR